MIKDNIVLGLVSLLFSVFISGYILIPLLQYTILGTANDDSVIFITIAVVTVLIYLFLRKANKKTMDGIFVFLSIFAILLVIGFVLFIFGLSGLRG